VVVGINRQNDDLIVIFSISIAQVGKAVILMSILSIERCLVFLSRRSDFCCSGEINVIISAKRYSPEALMASTSSWLLCDMLHLEDLEASVIITWRARIAIQVTTSSTLQGGCQYDLAVKMASNTNGVDPAYQWQSNFYPTIYGVV
jgi:hypothetical protein